MENDYPEITEFREYEFDENLAQKKRLGNLGEVWCKFFFHFLFLFFDIGIALSFSSCLCKYFSKNYALVIALNQHLQPQLFKGDE